MWQYLSFEKDKFAKLKHFFASIMLMAYYMQPADTFKEELVTAKYWLKELPTTLLF